MLRADLLAFAAVHALFGNDHAENRSSGDKAEKQADWTYAGAEDPAEEKRYGKNNGKENNAEPKRRGKRSAEERIRVEQTENEGYSENQRTDEQAEYRSADKGIDLFLPFFEKERDKTQS